MKKTINFELNLPESEDFYDVGDSNANFEKIDTQLKKNADDLAHKTYDATDVGAVPVTRKINDKILSTDITLTAADVGAVPLSQKGVANGISTLDSSGKIPKSQLPTTGGYVRQTTAPTDTSLLWMDSGHSDIMKYYNGTAWVAQPSVWG